MDERSKQLKESVLNYFKELNITLEPRILESFDQAFDDFDFISQENDDVNIYMKEDINEFQDDLTMTNAYDIVIDGISSGIYNATYTYIDNIEYITNEKTDLRYKDEVIEELVNFQYTRKTKVIDPNEWVISVKETITWTNGDYIRMPKLYIYCPYEGVE